jgi:hypothetical protein
MGRILALAALLLACNDHPLYRLDGTLTAADRVEVTLPPRTPVDLLFVVDDSGSMAEEQANLARNFRALSDALLARLSGAADFRVAVTSTDVSRLRGAFVRSDDPACADVPLVLRADPGADPADLARQFACLTTLGTRGSNVERGLEAMRLALSCDGPNADRFAPCCAGGAYDPACAGAPEFLRPDALLVVVFVSDEDDCSESPDDPLDAHPLLAICAHGPSPDAWDDPEYCAPGRAADCARAECGDRDPAACFADRCSPEGLAQLENERLDACVWFHDRLAPVADYEAFLVGLKRDPRRQILVAAITGSRVATDGGHVASFHLPIAPLDPACAPADPDTGPLFPPTEACCPDGRCEGHPLPACASANGRAATGFRYLELADRFGANGLSAPICTDDFAAPLGVIGDRVVEVIGTFCLGAPPACDGPDCIRVTEACESAGCDDMFAPRDVTGWRLLPESTRCGGGPALRLDPPPPPGATVVLDYLVSWHTQPGSCPAALASGE